MRTAATARIQVWNIGGSEAVAELFLVRHAQASFHSADYDCLTTLGQQQSRWLGDWFAMRGMAFDAFVTGTLKRHGQTLDGVLEGMGHASGQGSVVLPGLDEYDFRALVAAYAGAHGDDSLVQAWRADQASKSAFYRVLKLAMQAWAEDALPGPLPESWSGFVARIEEAAAQLQQLAGTHRRILAISSGGAMATLLGGRLQLDVAKIVDLNLQIRNTSVSHFHLNRERFLLSSWNAVPHLEQPGRDQAISYG